MKNIHILPTDKPSRLYFWEDKLVFGRLATTPMNRNIYITSDEEIKDVRPHKGKWQLEQGNILNKFPDYLTDLSECKLVILTTDQDLIKDGVQAIDDEFLEWFVKNPSCEEVFLTNDFKQVNQDNPILRGSTNVVHKYKIILPKEEPKKVLTEEDIFNQRDIDAVTDYINKEQQKQHLIDIMTFDEKLGLYEDGSQGYNKQAELVKQLTNKLKCESETSYGAEEVRKIAEWSFHFYKGEDLSDSELEKKWKGLLNERLRKK